MAVAAEKANHHPVMRLSYDSVEVWFTTHDQNNKVTSLDHEMSKAADTLYSNNNSQNDTKLAASVANKTTSKDIKFTEVKIYTDGGSRGNPGPSAAAFVVEDMDGNVVEKSGDYIGITTNNQAEYQALKKALDRAISLGVKKVHIYMDSLLVVNQINGLFKVKNRDLWPIYEKVNELKGKFSVITFQQVPRQLNKIADAEVNRILDEQVKSV